MKYRGESARLHQLSLASVLPNTGDYITYEGRFVRDGNALGTVSRKKGAVLLDFVQITLPPPPPPNLDKLYHFF